VGRVAVDTNVLIASLPTVADTADPRFAQTRAAQHLMDEGQEIVVPAPAWFEMLRKCTNQEAQALAPLAQRLRIEAVDAAAAERAGELVRAAVKTPLCDACLNEMPPGLCNKCGAARPKSALLLDALIVAVAEVQGCSAFYTFDETLVRVLSPLARVALRVPRPPPQGVLPLAPPRRAADEAP
jgi:predicted nucleic acid-binding protein